MTGRYDRIILAAESQERADGAAGHAAAAATDDPEISQKWSCDNPREPADDGLIRERRGVPAIAADSGGSEEDVSHLPVSLRAHLAGSSKAPLRGASSQWRSGERGRTTMDPGRAQDPTCCAAINRPWFVHEGMRSN